MRNAEEVKKNARENRITKRVFVSAKYFLNEVAYDESTVYPVYLSSRSTREQGLRVLHNYKEVLDIISSPFTLESSVLRVKRRKDGTYIDMERGGKFTLPEDIPGIRPGSVLTAKRVRELYDWIFCVKPLI